MGEEREVVGGGQEGIFPLASSNPPRPVGESGPEAEDLTSKKRNLLRMLVEREGRAIVCTSMRE